jgi:hypothetical protein
LWLDWGHQLLESLNNTIIRISDDDRTLLIHVPHLPPTHFAAFLPVNSELPAIFICQQLYICSTLWKCWFFMSRTYMIGILWDQIMPSKLWHKKIDEFKDLSNGDLVWSVCSASAWWRSLWHAVVTWVSWFFSIFVQICASSAYITVQCSSQLWPVLGKRCLDVHCPDFGIHSKTHMWILDSKIEMCWIMVILPWFNCAQIRPT